MIATSSGAGAAYVKEHLADMRLGMFLEAGTAAGASCGAFLAGPSWGAWLFLISPSCCSTRRR